MKKTLLFATILAMATFSSCSKDEVVNVNRNSDKMSFGAHIGSATKAIVTDATNFTDYNLYGYQTTGDYTGTAPLTDCYINNEAFIKKDGSWTHDNEFYWSTDANEKMQFFGVTPATVINAVGNYPKFSYTVKANIAEQEDFMVSALLNQTKPANDEKITLDFKHILSQVNFSLKGESADFKYTVTKIELIDANSVGDFTFDGTVNIGAWSDQKTSATYNIDLTDNNVVDGTTPLRVENNIMMLLPQTLSEYAKIRVTYSVTQNGRTSKIFDGSKEISIANKVWAKNTRTRYTLTLPVGGDKMEFDTNVSDWEAEISEVLSTLTLNKTTTTIVAIEKETLIPNLTPSNENATYTWESNDPTIAKVDPISGEITAISEGNAIITVTAKDGETVLSTATCSVSVTPDLSGYVYIPDAEFKSCLKDNKEININGDAEISYAEAESYTKKIYLGSNNHMEDLTGIEAFKNITELDCGGGLGLVSLNVNNNPELKILNAGACNNLKTLNLENLTKLTIVNVNDSKIKSIDVSKNKELQTLNCGSCEFLATINTENLTKLTTILCFATIITNLNISTNIALKELSCYTTKVTSLDLSKNIALEIIDASLNPELISLNISNLTKLIKLTASRNPILTTLDVSNHPELTTLDASINPKLTTLEASGNPKLEILILRDNYALQTIDLSESPLINNTFTLLPELRNLNISGNTAMYYLDLSNNTKLTHLNCSNSKLRGSTYSKKNILDIKNNVLLTNLNCSNAEYIHTISVWESFNEASYPNFIKDDDTPYVK